MGRPDLGTRERVGERSGGEAGKRETRGEECRTGLRRKCKVLPLVQEKCKVLSPGPRRDVVGIG
jgi:hypothetical protein